MPITIARFVQTEQCGWAKYALFGWKGRRNKGLIGWSSSPKAVGYIKKRAERSYQQYFQLPLFSVLLASALMGANDERSPRNSSSHNFNRSRDQTGWIAPVSTLPNLGNWSTPLLNSLHEQKPSCLPLPPFSDTSGWFFGCGFFLPISCVSYVACVYCDCNTFEHPRASTRAIVQFLKKIR